MTRLAQLVLPLLLLHLAACSDSAPAADMRFDQGADAATDAPVDAPRDGVVDAPDDGAVEVGADADAGSDISVDFTFDGVLPDLQRIDAGPPPDAGTSGVREYVIDHLQLPRSLIEGRRFGHDYSGDGIADNALGNLIGLLVNVLSNSLLPDNVSLAVANGTTLTLLRVAAASFVDHSGANVTTWRAAAKTCCSSAVLSTCQAQAATTCFDGNGTFTSTPPPSQLSGNIVGTVGTFMATSLPLTVNIAPSYALTLDLTKPLIVGRFASNRIVEGRINGVLTQAEISGSLVPALAFILDAAAKSTATPASTRQQILAVFDTDSDGTVTTTEVGNNSLIKTTFAGDVDIDNDGVRELSVGVGFTAVGATIQ